MSMNKNLIDYNKYLTSKFPEDFDSNQAIAFDILKGILETPEFFEAWEQLSSTSKEANIKKLIKIAENI